MDAAGALVSLDEYLSSVYDPDCEYIDGELAERNMGEFDHSALQGIIFALLHGQRLEAGVHIFPELRVQVSPTRFRIPDITVTTRKGRGTILTVPPFLCVEILSPEDRATRMESRIDDYLNFGVQNIWVIDPRRRNATSYTSEGRRESSQFLATANPRLTLALAEVFAALEEELES